MITNKAEGRRTAMKFIKIKITDFETGRIHVFVSNSTSEVAMQHLAIDKDMAEIFGHHHEVEIYAREMSKTQSPTWVASYDMPKES
jgi:hypothetical protein